MICEVGGLVRNSSTLVATSLSSVVKRRVLESAVSFLPIDFPIRIVPLNKGRTFASPLGKLLDSCGVRLRPHERSNGLTILPYGVSPESLVQEIRLKPVSHDPFGSFQLLFHPSRHAEEWYYMPPLLDRKVGANRCEILDIGRTDFYYLLDQYSFLSDTA